MTAAVRLVAARGCRGYELDRSLSMGCHSGTSAQCAQSVSQVGLLGVSTAQRVYDEPIDMVIRRDRACK